MTNETSNGVDMFWGRRVDRRGTTPNWVTNRLFSKEQSKVILVFSIILSVTLGCSSKGKREDPIAGGETLPTIKINYRLTREDAQRLGLRSGKSFRLQDIPGDIIVLGFMNVYCDSCRKETPTMNDLYRRIQNDSILSSRVKLLSFATANEEWEILSFKERFAVSYPIIPDLKLKTFDKLGLPNVPYHLVIQKINNELVVSASFAGIVNNVNKFVANLKLMLELETSTLLEPKQKQPLKPIKPPELTITEEEMILLLTEQMAMSEWDVLGIEKVELKTHGLVYMGNLEKDRTTRKLFARVESRRPLCDICEDSHFAYIFDNTGEIVQFVPIQLTKDENKP